MHGSALDQVRELCTRKTQPIYYYTTKHATRDKHTHNYKSKHITPIIPEFEFQ